ASNALIENNVLANNLADQQGGGVYWQVGVGEPGPTVVNNTFFADVARDRGAELYANGSDAQAVFANNIVDGSTPTSVIECGDWDRTTPLISFNDVYNWGTGALYGGICVDQTTNNGNLAANPALIE